MASLSSLRFAPEGAAGGVGLLVGAFCSQLGGVLYQSGGFERLALSAVGAGVPALFSVIVIRPREVL